jgi:streptogramin lyase
MKRVIGSSTWVWAFTIACGGTAANPEGSGSAEESGLGEDASASASAGSSESGSASADATSADTGADDDGLGTGPVIFDVGNIPDTPDIGCGGGDDGGGGLGDLELSYIWISNSQQMTVSKIDTQTMVEEGRYYAKQAGGDPSRTSVNLNGDVAVANRNGGVAKFWANVEDCQDTNGTPGIQTSTGANDILAWDQEECRAWNLELTCGSNRPVAWTRGEWSEATCSYENEKLWTVCDNDVYLIDGETGVIEQTIAVPAAAYSFVYGGAADADGNFWGLDTGSSRLFRVDHLDFTTLDWALPAMGGYGITVDKEGRPWVCGGGQASRFNLDTSTWDSTTNGYGGIGGCMTDGDTTLWHSDPDGTLMGYDIETLDVVDTIQLPQYVHGISVDFDGNVWGVGFANNFAYRANPETGQIDTFDDLVGAYTYSDMTGFALTTAGGGGVPQG